MFSCVQPLALPHERSTPLRDLPRDPRQNPQNKMQCSTSGAFHLILSMQYHLTRRARSREVRLLGGRVPLSRSSREGAIVTVTHQNPQNKMQCSTRCAREGFNTWGTKRAV
ncbi:protein of unknown function [Methanoculleus bourgensis]|uniref:Uncharacterized protein n=1 Tax=Methanoculleus bourgensis TaxID=83986 RepID=A0A0X8Y076_9EURY|nr:protein of unknown function [Methanoculleus bourgensis]